MTGLSHDLRSGKTVCAVSIASASAAAVEVAGDLGFSAVVLDARHSSLSPYSRELEGLVRAARAAAVPALVKVPESTPGTINRALNDGADGVIVPRVESAAQARDVVHASRYPPLGHRGAAPVVRAAQYGLREWKGYLREANEERLIFVSLESAQALDAAPGMLGIAGLDGVVIDTLSLAIALDAPSSAPDALPAAVAAVSAARAAGRTAAAAVFELEHAEAWARAGCGLVILDCDVTACARAMVDARASMTPAGSLR